MIATAAAVGSVATGTFTALLPTPGDGTTTSAEAATPLDLVADTTIADTDIVRGAVAPVGFAQDATGGATSRLASLDKAVTLAAQLAEQHAKEAAAQAERAKVAGVIANGGVDGWIAEALQTLELPQSLAPSVKKIIMKESGGNPGAINRWDSNARRGTPSQGLMQTIPSTFRKFVHPAYSGRSITDPVANITAGVRYMVATYGLDTLEAGGRRNSSGGYVGY